MDTAAKLEVIRARTRRRLVFTVITLLLYFSFVLNWTAVGDRLAERLGASHITGSLVMFAALIIFFILLELVFLLLNQATSRSGEET